MSNVITMALTKERGRQEIRARGDVIRVIGDHEPGNTGSH